jgi:hypothetical protein
MKRERLSTAKNQQIRARNNPLFFNNLTDSSVPTHSILIAANIRFAQTCCASQNIQPIAVVEHRPASRPGAD